MVVLSYSYCSSIWFKKVKTIHLIRKHYWKKLLPSNRISHNFSDLFKPLNNQPFSTWNSHLQLQKFWVLNLYFISFVSYLWNFTITCRSWPNRLQSHRVSTCYRNCIRPMSVYIAYTRIVFNLRHITFSNLLVTI